MRATSLIRVRDHSESRPLVQESVWWVHGPVVTGQKDRDRVNVRTRGKSRVRIVMVEHDGKGEPLTSRTRNVSGERIDVADRSGLGPDVAFRFGPVHAISQGTVHAGNGKR